MMARHHQINSYGWITCQIIVISYHWKWGALTFTTLAINCLHTYNIVTTVSTVLLIPHAVKLAKLDHHSEERKKEKSTDQWVHLRIGNVVRLLLTNLLLNKEIKKGFFSLIKQWIMTRGILNSSFSYFKMLNCVGSLFYQVMQCNATQCNAT